jgi:hypothetical protein
MNPIEGYASATSVFPGETITFNVCVQAPYFNLKVDIYRVGQAEVLLMSGQGHAMTYPTPPDVDEVGCGWPPAYTLTIPSNWSSGIYVARISSMSTGTGTATTDLRFAVKAATPGQNSRILFQLVTNTPQAYNNWGGYNLYSDLSGNGDNRVHKASFNRPTNVSFFDYEIPFVQWLENNGIVVEYCTSIDLHNSADLLNKYQLLLSVGHDEYWSKEMRDNVEAFVESGRNVAFFSGNVCWWQVRFEDVGRTMVCFKDANQDPTNGVDSSRVTVLWRAAPVDRPENQMTGVSFDHGGGWYDPKAGPLPAVGYRVRLAEHWIFAGTELNDGDEFGKDNFIVGYEADGAQFVEQDGIPQVTCQDGTPSNFLVLATADLSSWGTDTNNWAGSDGKGCATMGLYQNNGVVFNAASTDWFKALGDSSVSQITLNVLGRLQQPASMGVGIDGYDLLSTADRAIPYDYDGSGKLDHLVLYRPGTGMISILQNVGGTFTPVYTSGDSANGIGSYDLNSAVDQAFAFDYDSSGKLDHLVLYRPGTGTISILKNTAGTFAPVYFPSSPSSGIGGYDLSSPADQAFAFDYDSSGELDHLVLYRRGTGMISILQNVAGTFIPVYASGNPPNGIGGYDLSSPADQMFAFDYDGSGKLDHLVLYRPGTSTISILKNTAGTFAPVYFPSSPSSGIGGYDLSSPADQAFAFDYDSSGNLDHLVLYRPGIGMISILQNVAGTFTPAYASGNPPNGIGGDDLSSPADQMFGFDYDGSGKLDHLVLYRPGTGMISILKKTNGTFSPIYAPV